MMNLITDFFFFIKTLFTKKPKEQSELIMKSMDNFPFKGYKYLMWCGYIIYRKDNEDKIKNQKRTIQWKRDMRHETIHLKQAQDCCENSFITFYLKYLWQWIIGNPFSKESMAYYTNPFEMEAYANEDSRNYLITRNGNAYENFYIKPSERKNYFNKAGGSASEWKNALKAGVWK